MKVGWILFIVILNFILSGCSKDDAASLPAEISITKLEVQQSTAFGTTSSNISDVWVNIDGNLLGVYELPAKIQIISEGRHKITIRAGIKANGIAASRKWYPFYTSYTVDTVIVAGATINLNPKITYRPEVKVAFNETFEENGTYFTRDTLNGSDTCFEKVSSAQGLAFEGNYSGAIHLPLNKSLFRSYSSTQLVLPKNEIPVYMEFNYKTNITFKFGIIVNTRTESFLYSTFYYVNPSQNWNKIYYELTDILNANINAVSFNIYIEAAKFDANSIGEVLLDNIKVLHF